MGRRIITCRRCDRTAPNKGRGLCSACYGLAHYTGDLDDFDLLVIPPDGLYCTCAVHVPVAIPLFRASMCATCKRPARPMNTDERTTP